MKRQLAWAWPVAALLLAAALLAPFLVVDVPAVLDYPNHLARFYLLAHPHDPILSRMYAPHWAVLPNIGMDLLGQALLRILPPYAGGGIILALSLFAPIAGTAVYARAAFGRWTWWSLGAGVIAYNGIFFLGFMNFLLGLGVALAGAGLWRALRRSARPATAAAVGSVTALCAFFCHLLGYGFFALLITAQEADALFRLWRDKQLSMRQAASAAASLSVALAPAALLYRLTHHATARGDTLAWAWQAKVVQWLVPFMSYDLAATIITAVIVMGAAVLVWKNAERAVGVGLALGALGVLFVAAPFAAGGGTFVDSRVPLMAALLLFAGVSPRLTPRVGWAIASAFALLAVGRSALVAVNWRGHAHDLAELRAELAYVREGATILPAQTEPPDHEQGEYGRSIPNYSRLDDHLAALAMIERRCFWPLLFADPSQQPVVVLSPYKQIADPLGSTTPWRLLFDQEPTTEIVARYPYLAHWRTRFDYVLLVGPKATAAPAGLALIRAGDDVSLFRIDH